MNNANFRVMHEYELLKRFGLRGTINLIALALENSLARGESIQYEDDPAVTVDEEDVRTAIGNLRKDLY